jgi:predicted transcriptional regulator of viral defense system
MTTTASCVRYVGHCAGLDHVATVLTELAEKIDAGRLLQMAELSPIAWVQRLVYLIELVGAHEKAEGIAGYIQKKRPVRTPLAPSLGIKGAKMESRWRVFVNTQVESDL